MILCYKKTNKYFKQNGMKIFLNTVILIDDGIRIKDSIMEHEFQRLTTGKNSFLQGKVES